MTHSCPSRRPPGANAPRACASAEARVRVGSVRGVLGATHGHGGISSRLRSPSPVPVPAPRPVRLYNDYTYDEGDTKQPYVTATTSATCSCTVPRPDRASPFVCGCRPNPKRFWDWELGFQSQNSKSQNPRSVGFWDFGIESQIPNPKTFWDWALGFQSQIPNPKILKFG